MSLSLSLLALGPALALAQYTATYTPTNEPNITQTGQTGYNDCGTASSPTSMCQNLYINSVDDFCLWGPPSATSPLGDGTPKIGNVEEIVVANCLKDGYGTRLIPAGTITGAHFVTVMSDTVSYVQVTGAGDMTKIGLYPGDEGGELDPHSWTGLGNPQGGVVFTNAFSGSYEQTHEWTSFMSSNNFCVRACRDGPNAPGYCEHIYDTLGCSFTIPGTADPGFDDCQGSPAEQPGVYSGSTFSQGDPSTPAPHPPGPTSQCTTFSTIGGGSANLAAGPTAAASNSNSGSSANSTASATGAASGSSGSSASITSSASGPSRASASQSTTARASNAQAAASGASASASATPSSAAGRVQVAGAGVVGVAGLVMGWLF